MTLGRSKVAGRVREITHIVPFRQGGPAGLHGIRYADRCRIVLEAFADLENEGFVLPVRRFTGIHFARWALIDGDTRLLFTTNFDGSWEEYIRAFVREIPWSLGLVWQNCENYPPDRIGPDGEVIAAAADYALFSKFVDRYQVEASLFYADYGELSVRDVRYLRLFYEETSRALETREEPSPSLGDLHYKVMARQRALDDSYRGLPRRPFPEAAAGRQLSEGDKAIFRARVAGPIKALYGYDQRAIDEIFVEFGLQPAVMPTTPSVRP
jgi:hypothetical protein